MYFEVQITEFLGLHNRYLGEIEATYRYLIVSMFGLLLLIEPCCILGARVVLTRLFFPSNA